MMTFKSHVLAWPLVCALLGAQTSGAQDPSPAAESAGDVYAHYTDCIHSRPTGVYEWNGWIFFHDRSEMEESGYFRKQKAKAAAIARVERAIFEKISSLMPGASPASQSDVYLAIPGNWFDERTEASRAIRALPSRILSQTDEENVYVFDMAVRLSDLKAEAGKGAFKARPDAHARQWKEAVSASLTAPDKMAFFRDTGALDLWTLLSEKTSGTVSVAATTNPLPLECHATIDALRLSAQRASGDAASEYVKLLDTLYDSLTAELVRVPELLTDARVKTMVLSFASCTVEPATLPSELAERFADCLRTSATNAESRAQLVSLVSQVPGSSLLWCGLSAKVLEVGAPHVALSCARNALRCAPGETLALDALRAAYDALGCPALARGAAAPILALSDDAALRRKAEAQLQRSQP